MVLNLARIACVAMNKNRGNTISQTREHKPRTKTLIIKVPVTMVDFSIISVFQLT